MSVPGRCIQGRNLGSALGGYVGTMPDEICIARRKVFFSGDPLIFSLQPKNRYTSSYIALYWPLPPPPLAGPDYTWLLGGNVRWFLFAEIGPTICCPLPDEASFLQNGRGVSPPKPPREFRPWMYYLALSSTSVNNLSVRH